ncbi:unnamed protein product (macronuclear) [Paramecium tetraurelia]|uniref:F-box domain-containing protein n=1 Tax=Paramecium tetraurelia TaxID=5888 RepID=A0BZZ2_PARTE|nr:uncharacterized protein GSPATT00005961001 [Paramecium tetraurelia]CAK64109.1 unnamed protein product [Paramecium tetraurelia]|eukprot:XP_001431507.1 hypothetical protein (macronuclear) [Paramecium tetraurelia strain d4-2]
MDDIRKMVIDEEQERYNQRENLLREQFGYSLNDNLNQELINQIPPDIYLWKILQKIEFSQKLKRLNTKRLKNDQQFRNIRVKEFIRRCLIEIIYLHSYIVEAKMKSQMITHQIQTLKQQIKILQENQQQNCDQTNRLTISYSHNKSQKSKVFQNYIIKCKVALNQQEQQSIYSYGEDKICSFVVQPEIENILNFIILGKNIDNGDKFEILATKKLNLDEILAKFDVLSFSKKYIKHQIINLNIELNRIQIPNLEFRFQLQLPYQQRIVLIEGMLERQRPPLDQYNEEIEQNSNFIKQILVPFHDVVYIQGQGIKRRNRESCSSCIVF